MADYRDDLLEVAPHGWGRMGVATVLSGCHEEEKLKQMVADLVSDDHDVRYEALGWMQQACVNNALASDLLLMPNIIENMKKAVYLENEWDKVNPDGCPMGDEEYEPGSAWGWASHLLQVLSEKTAENLTGSMHFDIYSINPTKVPIELPPTQGPPAEPYVP